MGASATDGITLTGATAPELNAKYGGTWELIDKVFADATGSSGYSRDTTNCTAVTTFSWARGGHSIYLAMEFTNKVQIADDALTMFTINFPSLGCSRLPAGYWGISHSDAAQCAAFVQISTAGVFTTRDMIPDNYISAGREDNRITVNFTIPVKYMLDSACSQFVFKRTE